MLKYFIRQVMLRVHINPVTHCWEWEGSFNSDGYGKVKLPNGKIVLVHRFVYAENRGPIPEGLVCDHKCRVRHCCNPDHIEIVTEVENIRRGDVARHGVSGTRMCRSGRHVMNESNIVLKDNSECCKECIRLSRQREQRRRCKASQEG